MTADRRIPVDRQEVAELISRAMSGRAQRSQAIPFETPPGTVKTFAMEVNVDGDDPERAVHRLGGLAEDAGLAYAGSDDPRMQFVWGDGVSLAVDQLDPRFWLVHTTSAAGKVQRLLRRAVWASTDIDWCWFPGGVVRAMQGDGETKWFKSDFRGDELLAHQPVDARRLKVQLEGDQAQRLFDLLAEDPRYRSSAALTAIALRIGDLETGVVDVAAHYQGRFTAKGNAFEVHVGFVSKWVRQYAAAVRAIESDYAISWSRDETGGYGYTGRPVMINLGRPIEDLDHFAASLFSSRDPFRLWAIPRHSGTDAIEAEAVDLHLGQQFRLDITKSWLRIYLPEGACGNTVFRLISNLQHRYDASIVAPEVSSDAARLPGGIQG